MSLDYRVYAGPCLRILRNRMTDRDCDAFEQAIEYKLWRLLPETETQEILYHYYLPNVEEIIPRETTFSRYTDLTYLVDPDCEAEVDCFLARLSDLGITEKITARFECVWAVIPYFI